MEFSNLGFDFSNLSACTIKKKNQLTPLVFFIIGIVLMPIFLVFGILYILEVPIEINGVLTYYNDPEYNAFFLSFLPIISGLSIIFLIAFILTVLRKPRKYIVIDRDTRNFDKIYYIYDKNQEIYLADKYAIKLDKRFNKTYHETNKEVLSRLKSKYLFWEDLINLKDAKISHRNNTTVVSMRVQLKYRINSFRNTYKKFILSNNINVVPETIIETISYGSRGSSSYQSRNKYYFENVNRAQHLRINPEIKKVLHGLT